MAKIRVVEADNARIALVVNDKTLCYWDAPKPGGSFIVEEKFLLENMLREAYEKGCSDKEEQIRLVLRDILSV